MTNFNILKIKKKVVVPTRMPRLLQIAVKKSEQIGLVLNESFSSELT